MLVKNWMSTHVRGVDKDETFGHAKAIMQKYEIRMLPVKDQDQVVGILSDRDIKRASLPDQFHDEAQHRQSLVTPVCRYMTRGAVSVSPLHTVEEAAELLLVNKISGLPVMDENRHLVGIITQSDLFRAMVSLTGIGKKGIQFCFYVKDQPGCIRQITDILRDYGSRIASIMATHQRCERGFLRIYIRVYDIDAPSLERAKEVLAKTATIVYVVDHMARKREIYDDPLAFNVSSSLT